MFNNETKKEKIKIIFWKFVEIILFIVSVGKKPPPEINVILKFRELNSRSPDKFNKLSMPMLRNEYIINILIKLSLILSSELKLLSPEYVRLVILKLNDLFENIIIKKNKKNNPPIHCEEDLQRIRVGSRYFISLKIENPVPVNPEIDSNIEFKNVTW